MEIDQGYWGGNGSFFYRTGGFIMKRALLERPSSISKENKILVKLFEESLSRKLDEIFKKESPNLYNNLSKGLKQAICHLNPEEDPSSNTKSNN